MNFKPALCPSCGGSLQVPDNLNNIKCMYCGVDVIVKNAIQLAGRVKEFTSATVIEKVTEWKPFDIAQEKTQTRTYFPHSLFLRNESIESKISFENATFTEAVRISESHFKNDISFYGAVFCKSLEIKDTTFDSELSFNEAEVHEGVRINNSKFAEKVDFFHFKVCGLSYFSFDSPNTNFDFHYARFCRDVSFKGCKFGEVNFTSSVFWGEAEFSNSNFLLSARFDNSRFAEDAVFRHTKFNYICVFDNCYFHKVADFTRAEFNDFAHFEKARFASENSLTDWNYGGYFEECRFKSYVDFTEAKFKHASFSSSEFSKFFYLDKVEIYEYGNFTGSVYESDVYCSDAKFYKKVAIGWSTFKGVVRFAGSSSNKVFYDILDIQHIEVEKPEKVYFHTVMLRPNWFVNSNCKNFNFTACIWKMPDNEDIKAKTEIESLSNREIPHSYELLTKTCWQLADNHEETKSFPEASLFRRIAFESERLGRKERQQSWWTDEILCSQFFNKFQNKLKKSPFDLLNFLYYWLSGYGEKWGRAFFWLLFIWTFFAMFYCLFGSFGSTGSDYITFGKSFGYSLQVMTLQKPEPRPYDWLTYLFYGFQTIVSPTQAALLILAVRRKFMR